MNKRQQKKLKRMLSEGRIGNYQIKEIHNPRTDQIENFAVLPLADAIIESFETPSENLSLRDRFRNFFKKDAEQKTSLASERPNTEMGVLGVDLATRYEIDDKDEEDTTRKSKYGDYERMDMEGTETRRSKDIFIKNAFLTARAEEEFVEVETQDKKVESILDDMDQRVGMDEFLRGTTERGMMFGDSFEELCFNSEGIVERIKWLPPYQMYRNEDAYGRIEYENAFTQRTELEVIAEFDYWQVVHTRYNHKRGNRYGTSMFEPSRRSWRVLDILENGIALQRLVGGDRLVFYIPVPKDIDEYKAALTIEKWKRKLKRRMVVDTSGRMDLTKIPMSEVEDLFIAVDDPDNPTRVDRLGGNTQIGELRDIEYFQNKVLMGLPTPKAYLNLERDVNAKATLNQQDIQFARSIRELQKTVAWTRRQCYERQLVKLGYDLKNVEFKIKYPSVNFVEEMIRQELATAKWELAIQAKSGMGIPTEWLLRNIVGLKEEDVQEIMINYEEPNAVPNTANNRKDAAEEIRRNRRLQHNMNDLRDRIDVLLATSRGFEA